MIFLPLKEFNYVGGPKSFLGNLFSYFKNNNIEYTEEIENCKSIIFPIKFSILKLIKLKKRNVKIIQRLDGIHLFPWMSLKGYTWYGLKYFVKVYLESLQIQIIYRFLSDKVIFQSRYCQNIYEKHYGKLPEGKTDVILNGVDIQTFLPSQKKELGNTINFIMTGSFRRLDMLEPVFKALDHLKDYDFSLNVIGPVKKDFQHFLDRDYVQYTDFLDKKDIAKELSKADIFLFSSINPPCPNAVLEATASGLPVISFDYGSMKELCHFNTELLAKTSQNSDKYFKTIHDLNYESFYEKIIECIKNYSFYRKNVLNNRESFSFNACGKKYVEASR